MSFCGVFPFATRPRGIRESSETGLIMSYHPMFDQEHDLCQHSRDWGWSFEEFDEFSFVRQVELEKDTDMQSDDTSSHLSLTTGSLLRLVTEHNAATGIITSQKTLASAQTPILRPRGPSLNNYTSFSSLAAGTVPSSPCTQSSTSLLDLYLLQASSCFNAGNEITLHSSAVMDSQPPKDKGVGHLNGSTTLNALEDLVEAYAASEHSDDSHAFIHAGDLNRQSYIDARLEDAAALAPASTPGPAPSLLPPMPACHPAPFRGELLDESEVGVPTPPTRILDHAGTGGLTRHKPDLWGAVDHEFSCRPSGKRNDDGSADVELQNLTHGRILDVPSFPYPVSNFLSSLNSGVFESEESDAGSTTAQRQSDDVVATLGEVSTFKIRDVDPVNYSLFPRAEFTPHFDPQQLRSRACSRAAETPSRLSRPYDSHAMEPNQRPVAPLGHRSRHFNYKGPSVATLPKGKNILRSEERPVSVAENSPSKSDVSYPSDRILTPYKSYVQLASPSGQHDDITPALPASVHTEPSTASMATTVPIENSGYDNNQDLALKRQNKQSPRVLEASGSHSLINDTVWLKRDIYGKRRSWALFVVCTICPPILLLYGFGGFDKYMVHIANTHAQPTRYQKKCAIYFSLAEGLFIALLTA
ncbi:hypothetical protein D6D22_00095 [Aureobasidium pullulans]|uniref:Uncharacterized protein n=1 Tax=Aureobasidium pullulans TaxID=5580 RepID=A0A4S8YMM6_AURPU|nr:hypothetical protein D6D22_00095 [Aureobasidium pullulans]